MIKKFAEMEITSETTRDGESFTTVTMYGDYKDTLNFKLNETFKSSAMGIESEESEVNGIKWKSYFNKC
ncbi:hypothetical protein ACOMHN_050196 [Nucella lapillus]